MKPKFKSKPATPRRPRLPKLPTSTLTAAFNVIEPNWRSYMDYVRIAARDGDGDMIRYIEVYDSLDRRTQKNILPEEVCERANVDTARLVGIVGEYLWKNSSYNVDFMKAIAHPKVVAKTIKSALSNSRTAPADRTNFLKATGFLPQPKAVIGNTFNAPLIGAGQEERPKLPSHEEEMKQLEAADAADIIEGEITRA